MKTATARRHLVKSEFIFYLRISQLCKSVQYVIGLKTYLGLTYTDSAQFQKKITKFSYSVSRFPKYLELGHFTLLETLRNRTAEGRGRQKLIV